MVDKKIKLNKKQKLAKKIFDVFGKEYVPNAMIQTDMTDKIYKIFLDFQKQNKKVDSGVK